MPKNFMLFFQELGETCLSDPDCQIPDPLVGDNRCQERAIYLAALFKNRQKEPYSPSNRYSPEEIAILGAAFFLTLITKRQYDGFGLIVMERTISKTNEISLTFGSNKELNSCIQEARNLIGNACYNALISNLSPCDYQNPQTKEPFKLKKADLPKYIIPFYPSVFASLKQCRIASIPLVLYNIKLTFNAATQAYTFDREDFLVFMPGEPFFCLLDDKLSENEPVFFIRSFQIERSDEPFQDDIALLKQKLVSIEGVLFKLAAIHPQFPAFSETTEACFMQEPLPEPPEPCVMQEPLPKPPAPCLFSKDIGCLKRAFAQDKTQMQPEQQYILVNKDKNSSARNINSVSLSVDHITASFYRDAVRFDQYVQNKRAQILQDTTPSPEFIPPDVHYFMKKLYPTQSTEKGATLCV